MPWLVLISTLALYVAEVHQPHQIARETLVTAVTVARYAYDRM
jgi:hypothetical protein